MMLKRGRCGKKKGEKRKGTEGWDRKGQKREEKWEEKEKWRKGSNRSCMHYTAQYQSMY